jgi:hypothetical protein
MLQALPARDGSQKVAALLNGLARFYPPILLWLALGGLGLVFRSNTPTKTHWFITGLSLFYLLISYLGTGTFVHYRIPFDSLYILCGVTGGAALVDYLRSKDIRHQV